MHINFQVLKYFLAITQAESITAACALMHVTQPTVSRQISDLEDKLGVKLFERGPRRITLTREGLLFKRRAEEILSLVDKTEEELVENTTSIEGKISIGAGELKVTDYLAQLMSDFRKQYPMVTFELKTTTSDVIRDEMDKGLLDLGLMLEPIDVTSYDFIRFAQKERWVAVFDQNHSLARNPVIRPKDLVHSSLILPGRIHTINEVFNWLGTVRNEVSVAGHTNLIAGAVSMAQAKLGIAVVVETQTVLNCPRLASRPLQPELTSGTLLAWKKNLPLSIAAEAFIRYVRDKESTD